MDAIKSYDNTDNDTTTNSEDSLIKINHELFNVSDYNNYPDNIYNMNLTEEIPIVIETNDFVSESITAFKNALIQRFRKLDDIIDFLKNELEEKILLIRTLLLRDANDGEKIDPSLLRPYSSTPTRVN